MSTAVKQLLDWFDALEEADKHHVAVEILRRDSAINGDAPEDALTEAADELFRNLDDEEAAHAQR